MAGSVSTSRFRRKPFAIWVIFGGLLYFGLAFIALILPVVVAVPAAAADPAIASGFVFAGLCIVAAFASLPGKRWGFALAAVVSVLILGLFASFILSTLSNPADPTYWLYISGVPALVLVTVFSILALLNVKRGIAARKYLASHESVGGLVTFTVIGFVIGAVIIATISSGLVNEIVGRSGSGADVRIVPNAANPQTAAPYSPKTLTVRAGTVVTWFNGDTTIHTVTSDTGLFDSGNLAPGFFWSHPFDQPGTYSYRCTPHPTMRGTIVVTP